MKHLKTFENYVDTETSCPECDCPVENCDCGCPSCGSQHEISERKKAKPDFLDLDKDGDKKEPMKKAAKEAKEKKDDKKSTGKGLTAAQMKLPIGLRKAIEKKKKG